MKQADYVKDVEGIYGDVYPVTPVRNFLGAIIAIFGFGMFAIPAGILASGYAEEIQRAHGKQKTCPHCGKNITSHQENHQRPTKNTLIINKV